MKAIIGPVTLQQGVSTRPPVGGRKALAPGRSQRWAGEWAQHTWPSHTGAVKHPTLFHEPFGHFSSVGPTPCCLTPVPPHGPTAMEKHSCVKARTFCTGLRSDSIRSWCISHLEFLLPQYTTYQPTKHFWRVPLL